MSCFCWPIDFPPRVFSEHPTMKGIGGCFFVLLGLLGLFVSIVLSFTFYLLPLAFVFFLGSLILISFALGPAEGKREGEGFSDRKKESIDRPKKGN